jgi:DNA-directed RNA polymerase subunit RPC12/RpoP
MSPSASPAGKFQCASCGKQFTWKPEIAGRSAKCKCGAIIAIPKSAPPSPAAAPSVAIPSQAINDEQPASDNTAETSDHAGASTLRTIFLLLIGFAAGLAAIVVLGTLAIKAMFPVPPRTADKFHSGCSGQFRRALRARFRCSTINLANAGVSPAHARG